MDYLVFISHSSEDRWIAEQMAAIIERRAKRHGVRVFLDEKDLEAGASIPEEIRRHLENCDEFLVLLTSPSIARQWVLVELGAAWGLRKRITAITDKVADDLLPDIINRRKRASSTTSIGSSLSWLIGLSEGEHHDRSRETDGSDLSSVPQPCPRRSCVRRARDSPPCGRWAGPNIRGQHAERGERWGERLRRELEACDVFMVIGSPRAATSELVLQELGGAWALDKPIVVVSPEEGWTWQLPVATHAVRHASVGDLEQPGFIERLLAGIIHPASSV